MSATFKDKFRDDATLHLIRRKGRAGYIQEALGFWSKNGRGWYSRESIDHCFALGRQQKAEIYCSRSEDPLAEKAFYFAGIDPARGETKKADDGAIVVLRAIPLLAGLPNDIRAYSLSFCYARKVRKADATQWSSIIHQKHIHFRFSGLCMDPGGGGIWIQPELRKEKQNIRNNVVTVRPIAALEDEEGMMVMGDFILSMFRPKDYLLRSMWAHVDTLKWENLIDMGHEDFREGLAMGIAVPPPIKSRPYEEVKSWSEEKIWANRLVSDPKIGIGAQLLGIFVAVDDRGNILLSKATQARKFTSKSRKDFAYAAMMAYLRFKMWMAGGGEELIINEEDSAMCGGSENVTMPYR